MFLSLCRLYHRLHAPNDTLRVCGSLEALDESYIPHVLKGDSYRQLDLPHSAIDEYKQAFALNQLTSIDSVLTAADSAIMIEEFVFARDLCAFCRRVGQPFTAEAIERALEYFDPQPVI